jgi:hypothetical protein
MDICCETSTTIFVAQPENPGPLDTVDPRALRVITHLPRDWRYQAESAIPGIPLDLYRLGVDFRNQVASDHVVRFLKRSAHSLKLPVTTSPLVLHYASPTFPKSVDYDHHLMKAWGWWRPRPTDRKCPTCAREVDGWGWDDVNYEAQYGSEGSFHESVEDYEPSPRKRWNLQLWLDSHLELEEGTKARVIAKANEAMTMARSKAIKDGSGQANDVVYLDYSSLIVDLQQDSNISLKPSDSVLAAGFILADFQDSDFSEYGIAGARESSLFDTDA